MSSASIKKIISCKKGELVEMVLDIEKYPEFVPWCIEGKIYDKKESSDLNILLEKDQNDFFCANEPKNKQYFANGVFGSSKNNILLMKIIEYLKDTYQEKKKKHPNKSNLFLEPLIGNHSLGLVLLEQTH